jgi:hypothetical protein
MLFALIVFLSAFLIEGIGTYVSVIGLAALFASNPIIITLAIALDVGKIVTVSFLYKNWKRIGYIMRSYMLLASIVLMVITSTGAFGYLSGEFQKSIQNTRTNEVTITAMKDEQSRLQLRKQEIDAQIAAIPPTYITGRKQIIATFSEEVTKINNRLNEIDVQLPQLQIDSIQETVEVGPIAYVAEAFSTTPEKAVKWVILTIIFVFDPLAIALIIAGNFLVEKRKEDRELKTVETPQVVDQPKDVEPEELPEEIEPEIPVELPDVAVKPEIEVDLEPEEYRERYGAASAFEEVEPERLESELASASDTIPSVLDGLPDNADVVDMGIYAQPNSTITNLYKKGVTIE